MAAVVQLCRSHWRESIAVESVRIKRLVAAALTALRFKLRGNEVGHQ
ncbi:unnamed protein product [Ixodes pacificus]